MSVNNPVARLLAEHPTLILDGALATELEARGCDLTDPLWSAKVLIENPELIYQVHLDYFNAGAHCAITASYQATPQGFLRRGLDQEQSLALIAKSVQLAQRARRDYLAAHPQAAPLLIAGSVGPYGAYLADGSEYRGDYRLAQDDMIAFHRPRLAALAAAGVDLLACETLPSFAELQALLTLLQARRLNLLQLGDEEAHYLGVNVQRAKLQLLLLSALLIGAAVAMSGVIGFVGLVVPHLVRMRLGGDHRWLLPCSALGGACLLLVSDTLARTLVAPAEMPVGLMTSLIGGPYFLWLGMRQRERTGG